MNAAKCLDVFGRVLMAAVFVKTLLAVLAHRLRRDSCVHADPGRCENAAGCITLGCAIAVLIAGSELLVFGRNTTLMVRHCCWCFWCPPR